MKTVKSFEEFINEGKMDLNTIVKASSKEYTWIYQTGKDSSKTAIEINKKLNDLGIKSFISKTTGDTVGIPTKNLKTAFDKVLTNYSNIKQFAYGDGTKNDSTILNEETVKSKSDLSFIKRIIKAIEKEGITVKFDEKTGTLLLKDGDDENVTLEYKY